MKATVVFKGREITYQELGKNMLDRFTEALSDIAKVESEAKMEGRQMIAFYVADKTKKKKTAASKHEAKES